MVAISTASSPSLRAGSVVLGEAAPRADSSSGEHAVAAVTSSVFPKNVYATCVHTEDESFPKGGAADVNEHDEGQEKNPCLAHHAPCGQQHQARQRAYNQPQPEHAILSKPTVTARWQSSPVQQYREPAQNDAELTCRGRSKPMTNNPNCDTRATQVAERHPQ